MKERIRDFFVEEINNRDWTGNFLLITNAYIKKGFKNVTVKVAGEPWTEIEAIKFTRFCNAIGVKSPIDLVIENLAQ